VKHRLSPAFAILFILVLFVSALANTPPVASFEVRTSADSSQTTLVFDATASHDPDGRLFRLRRDEDPQLPKRIHLHGNVAGYR